MSNRSVSTRSHAFLLLVAVACACAISQETEAQIKPEPRIGSLVPTKPDVLAAKETAQLLKKVAKCAYAKNRKAVWMLLEHSDPKKIDFRAAHLSADLREFGMANCLGDEQDLSELALKIKGPALRPLFAEEAYLDSVRLTPVLGPTAVRVVNRSFVSDAADLPMARAIAEFSDCIVYRDTAKSDALVRSMPGSDVENAAARALAPSLGACLPAGQKLSLTPTSVRSFVADGLWSRFSRSGSTVGKQDKPDA